MSRKVFLFIILLVISIQQLSSAQETAGPPNWMLTLNFPGVFSSEYHETIKRRSFAFDESFQILDVQDREYDLIFTKRIERVLDFGLLTSYRRYENTEGHSSASFSSVSVATTKIYSIMPVLQLRLAESWIQPYASFGAGYCRIALKDHTESGSIFPPTFFEAIEEKTLNELGSQFRAGVYFVAGPLVFGTHFTYLASSELDAKGWGLLGGFTW